MFFMPRMIVILPRLSDFFCLDYAWLDFQQLYYRWDHMYLAVFIAFHRDTAT